MKNQNSASAVDSPAPSPLTARQRLAVAARIARATVTLNGETFLVRGLTNAERAAVLANIRSAVDTNTLPDYAIPAAFGTLDDDGQAMFESSEEAREFFATLDGQAVETIGRKVLELAGLRKEAVEDTLKN